MSNKINEELIIKIKYLQKALDECMNIVQFLKEENASLKETSNIINISNVTDLSKIRGD